MGEACKYLKQAVELELELERMRGGREGKEMYVCRKMDGWIDGWIY
jgi:hypothetical protein